MEHKGGWNLLARLAENTGTSHPREIAEPCGHVLGGRRPGMMGLVPPGSLRPHVLVSVMSEFAVQEVVAERLAAIGATGYELRPMTLQTKRGALIPEPRYWELVVTGFGGFAPAASGAALTMRCPNCGREEYREPTNPAALAAAEPWDGSDIFLIWPLPKYLIVTDRIVQLFGRECFTGVKFVELKDLPFGTGGLAPGRLDDWLTPEKWQWVQSPARSGSLP